MIRHHPRAMLAALIVLLTSAVVGGLTGAIQARSASAVNVITAPAAAQSIASNTAMGSSPASVSATASTADDPIGALSLNELTGVSPAVLAGAAQPLSIDAAQAAEAMDFHAKLEVWLGGMEESFPEWDEFVDPGHEAFFQQTGATLDTLTPEQLHIANALLTNHYGFWELPDFLRALQGQAPMPPYYQALVAEWGHVGFVDESALRRLAPAMDARAREVSASMAPDAVPTPNATATVPFPTMPQFPPRGDLPDDPDNRVGCPGMFRGNTCDGCPAKIPLPVIFALETALTLVSGGSQSIDQDKAHNFHTPSDPDTDFCATAVVTCICISLPNPVYYILNSIRIVLEYTIRSLRFVNDLSEECEGNLHAAVAHLFMDETVSSRVTQKSLDAHHHLELRLAIEDNLLRNSNERINLFQLPSSYCGDKVPDDTPFMSGFEGFRFCGQLELARQIVSESIQRMVAAGQIGDAQIAMDHLGAGDQHFMLGQWRAAYERYSNAYRVATEQGQRR